MLQCKKRFKNKGEQKVRNLIAMAAINDIIGLNAIDRLSWKRHIPRRWRSDISWQGRPKTMMFWIASVVHLLINHCFQSEKAIWSGRNTWQFCMFKIELNCMLPAAGSSKESNFAWGGCHNDGILILLHVLLLESSGPGCPYFYRFIALPEKKQCWLK